MKGESSLAETGGAFMAEGGVPTEERRVDSYPAQRTSDPPSTDFSPALCLLRLILKRRLCPDAGGESMVLPEDFTLRDLPSLSAVFSRAEERRFALLGLRSGRVESFKRGDSAGEAVGVCSATPSTGSDDDKVGIALDDVAGDEHDDDDDEDEV